MDFEGKKASREANLAAARKMSSLWMDGCLIYDWLELIGDGAEDGSHQIAPMYSLLIERDCLSPGLGRFIGVDINRELVAQATSLYGESCAVWREADLHYLFAEIGPDQDLKDVGVLVFDSWELANKALTERLEFLFRFAEGQADRLTEFLLVINAIRSGKGRLSTKEVDSYKTWVEKRYGLPVKWEEYGRMILCRLQFGF